MILRRKPALSPGRSFSSPRHLALMLAGVGCYAFILWVGYRTVSVAHYSYLGFTYRTPALVGVVLGLLGLTALGMVLPHDLTKPSDYVLWFLYGVMIVPGVLVPLWSTDLSPENAVVFGMMANVSFALVALATWLLPAPSWTAPRPSGRWLTVAVVGFSVVSFGTLLAIMGPYLQLTSLTGVRELRLHFLQRIAEVGSVPAYLLIVQGNVIDPLIFVRGLRRRSLTLTLLGAVGQVVIYSATGYRTILLTIPVCLLLSWLLERRRDRVPAWWLQPSIAFVAAVATLTTLITGKVTPGLLVVRLLTLPAILSVASVAWFDHQRKAIWSYSFLSHFFAYPYHRLPPQIIGTVTSHDPSNYANTGYLGDGFINLGYPGVFIEALVLALVLWALNWAARGLPPVVCVALVVAPSMIVANVGSFTSILTGGFGAAFVAALVIPREGWTPDRKRGHAPLEDSSTSSTRT